MGATLISSRLATVWSMQREGAQVIICLIADGRRDMQSLLSRRLLGG